MNKNNGWQGHDTGDFFSSQMNRSPKYDTENLDRMANTVGKIVEGAVGFGLQKAGEALEEVSRTIDKAASGEAAERVRTKTSEEQEKASAEAAEAEEQSTRPQAAEKKPAMRMVRKPSSVPYYVVGGVWILYALLFPMYRVVDLLLAGALSVGAFFAARAVFKGKIQYVPVEEPAVPVQEDPADPEARRIIREGEEYLRRLAEADERIENEEISAAIRRMEVASRSIFNYVAEHPGKVSSIRKFMNYYLPTTLKLLDTYDRLSRQGVQGENISSTMFDIQNMMQTIASAFEKQLDTLFENEAMDVSADIAVMETMLRQEGLNTDDGPNFG